MFGHTPDLYSDSMLQYLLKGDEFYFLISKPASNTVKPPTLTTSLNGPPFSRKLLLSLTIVIFFCNLSSVLWPLISIECPCLSFCMSTGGQHVALFMFTNVWVNLNGCLSSDCWPIRIVWSCSQNDGVRKKPCTIAGCVTSLSLTMWKQHKLIWNACLLSLYDL